MTNTHDSGLRPPKREPTLPPAPHLKAAAATMGAAAKAISPEEIMQLTIQAIDDATMAIVNDLDKLAKEVEAMKQFVISNGAATKDLMLHHLKLGAIATAFAAEVKAKLKEHAEKAKETATIAT